MPLSLKQLNDVCLLNSGDYRRCRYLAQDDLDSNKWYCMKLSAGKSEIDLEAHEFLEEMKRKMVDPKKQGAPLGDNCSGYPILKFIEQGYDK